MRQGYGSWTSPISAEMIAGANVALGWPALDGGRVWWLERRPTEGGRSVVCSDGGTGPTDHTPSDHNVRSLVHEYGGRSYTVRDGVVWYANFADQRLWRRTADGQVRPITPEPASPRAERYADLSLSPDGSWLAAVRERHDGDGVSNEVVAVPADGSGPVEMLAAGSDFYAAPRISPDGHTLAWLAWDHPDMPWDATTLWIGQLRNGTVVRAQQVAGGPGESIFQPAWSPAGVLHFVSDADGWWNLYRAADAGSHHQLTREQAEFGLPLWNLGISTYTFLDEQRIACLVGRDAALRLHLLDTSTAELTPTALDVQLGVTGLAEGDGELAFVAATDTTPPAMQRWRPGSSVPTVVRRSATTAVPESYLSIAEPLTVTCDDGWDVHALYFPPTNPHPRTTSDERPPLLVDVHGGPTAQVTRELDMELQFWTSRGFAVAVPNYGGSTGYGRAYRERLLGQWGIVDVADSVAVAQWLVDRERVDGERLAIRGGSAGGFTTLAALTQTDVFSAGVSLYGVSDLRMLAAETHKFESRYLDRLVGDDPDAWTQRAPIEHVEDITAPLLILQGEEDAVVPPSQAELMVERLEAARSPYAYVTFPGEQHGFRQSTSIRRAFEVELSFYGQVFDFEPADDVERIEVRHLD